MLNSSSSKKAPAAEVLGTALVTHGIHSGSESMTYLLSHKKVQPKCFAANFLYLPYMKTIKL